MERQSEQRLKRCGLSWKRLIFSKKKWVNERERSDGRRSKWYLRHDLRVMREINRIESEKTLKLRRISRISMYDSDWRPQLIKKESASDRSHSLDL